MAADSEESLCVRSRPHTHRIARVLVLVVSGKTFWILLIPNITIWAVFNHVDKHEYRDIEIRGKRDVLCVLEHSYPSLSINF